MNKYGTIKIKFNELLDRSELTRKKMGHRAEMELSQIKKYYDGTVTRLDVDVLARICTVFDCKIEDLLEFVPPEEE